MHVAAMYQAYPTSKISGKANSLNLSLKLVWLVMKLQNLKGQDLQSFSLKKLKYSREITSGIKASVKYNCII